MIQNFRKLQFQYQAYMHFKFFLLEITDSLGINLTFPRKAKALALPDSAAIRK